MIYKPKTTKLWDTWMYLHNGNYYLYYLSGEGGAWVGVGLAISSDGVTWEEKGLVVPKAEDAVWMGTGSVWKSPSFQKDGRFIMNFSEWRGDRQTGQQVIFFAESADLIHWDRLEAEYEFKPDPRWYNVNMGGRSRWDCIYTIPRPGGGRYGYWTATPKTHVGFGFGESLDGVYWTALEPPVIEWGDIPPMHGCELGALEKFGEKYYAMLGTSNYQGTRGMYTLIADKPEGPFKPAPKNYFILTSRGHGNTYFARFFPVTAGMLVDHQSITRASGRDVYFAPLKRAVVDEEGTLRLYYWEGNEKLKGESIEIDPAATSDKTNGDGLAFLANTFDLEQGVIIEGTIDNIPAEKPTQGFEGVGFYIEEETAQGTAMLVQTGSLIEYGSMRPEGTDFNQEDWFDRDIDFGKRGRFRLLLRQSLSEFYIEDVMIQCYSLPSIPTGRIGLVLGSGKARIWDLKAWKMGIPRDQ